MPCRRVCESGRNVIAVEVHNAAPTSSDIKFNLSLDRPAG